MVQFASGRERTDNVDGLAQTGFRQVVQARLTAARAGTRSASAFLAFRTLVAALVLAGLVGGCGSPSDVILDPEPPVDTIQPRPVPCFQAREICTERVEITSGRYLPVFSSHELAEGSGSIVQAVVVIHGANRDADAYLETGVRAITAAGEGSTSLLVAPHYQTSDDQARADEPYWSNGGWRRGNLSLSEGPSPRVSSYLAIDRIVSMLADRSRYPILNRVIIAGHSAGGQFVHRYAATAPAEVDLEGIELRYVVTNPSTYLYLRSERWLGEEFGLPDSRSCPDYDDWHYGLRDRNSRTEDLSVDTIWARAERRDIRVLIGGADTTQAALDTSCGANLQGPNRFERGRTLKAFMDYFFYGHRHSMTVVPGVGHSSRSMWTSVEGVATLFGNE